MNQIIPQETIEREQTDQNNNNSLSEMQDDLEVAPRPVGSAEIDNNNQNNDNLNESYFEQSTDNEDIEGAVVSRE